jgi:hypothetical protein
MEVLDQHQVTDDRMQSTDWTSIGTRILEAATLATAIHLDELASRPGRRDAGSSHAGRWACEISDRNG